MSNSLISIIVPVYNAELFLRRCLNSIRTQTYTNFEAILIDDGSSDQSDIICDEYSVIDRRFIVIHKKNEGVSIARNVGMKKAHGEYIMFLDADDIMKKNCIEEYVQYSAFDIVVGGYEKFGVQTGSYGPIINKVIDIKSELLSIWEDSPDSYWWFVWGKLFRKDIISDNNLQFKTDMIYLEDFCFVLEYLSYIDNVYIQNSHNILHLVEISKYSKYKMDYNLLKIHMQAHEDAFSSLEKRSHTSFIEMRKRVAYRHFYNFMNYLIKSDIPFIVKLSNMVLYNKDKNKPKLFGYIVLKGKRSKIGWSICQTIYVLSYPLLYLKTIKNH